MTPAETVEALIAEMGPVLDPLLIESFSDPACWGVLIDEETPVLVDLLEQAGMLVLSIEVDVPQETRRPRLYEQLLMHNHRWEQQGGLRMALDQPGGSVVVVIQDLVIEGLDVTGMCSALTAFAASAQALREALTASSPELDLVGRLDRPENATAPGTQV